MYILDLSRGERSGVKLHWRLHLALYLWRSSVLVAAGEMIQPGVRYPGENDNCGSGATPPPQGSPAGSWRYWRAKRRESDKLPGWRLRRPRHSAYRHLASAKARRSPG